ncbi:MAG: carboxypeptidase-like regulatory domain-containing protein, partial [Prevotella sp.]|nr:carboxypeptidase-like regulatory domain-containing protein [Prevotella sp.]
MKRTAFILLLTLMSAISFAQERKISGTLVDRDTKEPMGQTTVQLLKMDSTFVAGAISDDFGKFSLKAPENGKYLLRISSVGYITSVKRIEMVKDHNLSMGDVVMNSDAVMLKGATVTGKAMKVVVREDTFVYNSAAYVTPEGSVVEELVKRLPGAQVSEDGKITINGKEVKKVKVGGKEFMTGDTQTAMKNLPTSIIDNIKVYDEKSDLSRITGIDDGNDETVLDFSVKAGMNKGFMSNADLGYGTHDRYTGRLFGMYTKDNFRIQGMANANNTGDRGFGGRGGGGRGGQGLNSSKMTGVNFSYDNDTIEIGGSVRWNHRDGDSWSKRATESFVSRSGAFSNSVNQNYSRSDSWNAQMRLEWKPDTMTNIMFRPSMSFSKNDGLSASISASFTKDPYSYVLDPLYTISLLELVSENVVVNQNINSGITYSDSKRFGGSLQFNRKLNSLGRNLTFRVEGNYTKGNS